MNKQAFLILQNGQFYQGKRFGAQGDACAELVFTTGMCGYLETLTDPGYAGQIVLQTFPLIGNYGFIDKDIESGSPHLSAYIIREHCDTPSNFRCQGTLESYMEKAGIIGLMINDTRALTRTLRDNGTMNAAIADQLPEDMEAFTAKLAQFTPEQKAENVGCQEPKIINEQGTRNVVLWDMGCKNSLVKALTDRDCRVTLMPASSTAAEILALRPQAVLIGSGPGAPDQDRQYIQQTAELMESGLPIMGIGLGHQLMALAKGASCIKLPYGHRGGSQAVRDVENGRLYMTSQNHGYAVDAEALPQGMIMRYENLNDHTCEGLEYPGDNAFSLQFQPENRGGSSDTTFLFDNFIDAINK